jgi:hypothetical protein
MPKKLTRALAMMVLVGRREEFGGEDAEAFGDEDVEVFAGIGG